MWGALAPQSFFFFFLPTLSFIVFASSSSQAAMSSDVMPPQDAVVHLSSRCTLLHLCRFPSTR